MANVERSYYGRIERGESQPTLFVVLKICSDLGADGGTIAAEVEFVAYFPVEMVDTFCSESVG